MSTTDTEFGTLGATGQVLPTSIPELSVVLVVGDLRHRAQECLRTLVGQRSIGRAEILLIDLATPGTGAIAGSDHLSVRTIPLSAETTYTRARVEGVRRARAPVVAFIEEHCRALPGWIDALLAAHQGPWAGVGGEVHNGNPEAPMSETIALMTYAPWLPPAARDEDAAHLPGHNASFRRERLLAFGDDLELLLVSDINLHRRLRLAGDRLLLDPAVKFAHINPTGLVSLSRGYFLWHRLYGWSRARVFRWNVWRRILYVALAPAIPIYFLLRLYREVRRLRPDLLPRFRRGLILIWTAQLVSAVGQGFGLLFGRGDSMRRFTSFELTAHRPTAP